jgi:hypothetical protein
MYGFNFLQYLCVVKRILIIKRKPPTGIEGSVREIAYGGQPQYNVLAFCEMDNANI